jgi:hypothetical protein
MGQIGARSVDKSSWGHGGKDIPSRRQGGRQGMGIASYLGLVPLEESSGNRRRLGHITKQGNALLRFLLVEAAQVSAGSIPEWRTKYFHLAMRRGRKIAKVAMARRLAVQMFWMWRKGLDYEQEVRFARGTARTSRWCALEHRVIDWVSRSSSPRSSKQ